MNSPGLDLMAKVLLGVIALCFLASTIIFALFCKAILDFISKKLGKDK